MLIHSTKRDYCIDLFVFLKGLSTNVKLIILGDFNFPETGLILVVMKMFYLCFLFYFLTQFSSVGPIT